MRRRRVIPFFRALAFQATRKKIDEVQLNAVHMKLNADDVSYFNLSSNMIMSFSQDGQMYYFRECPRITSKNDFFTLAMQRFFGTLNHLGISEEHFKQDVPIRIDFSKEEADSFRDYIESKVLDHHFLNKLAKTDRISNRIGFSIWKEQVYDNAFFSEFGFHDLPSALTSVAVYFLWCMRSTASVYRTLRLVRGKEHSFFNAVRSISSKIVADSFDLGDLITDCQWCILELGEDESLFGTVSPAAPGVRMCDCKVAPSGSLQIELTKLNIIDLISYQTDHGPNNYNISIDKSEQCRICAFDNDNPSTFFPIPFVSHSLSQCSPLIDRDGLIARPYMDKTTAANIQNINLRELKGKLKPYLNFLQIYAVALRVEKLKRAITKTQRQRAMFLLSADEINENLLNEEMRGTFGTTYLLRALRKN